MIIQIYEATTPAEALALARCGVDHVGVLVGSGEFARELSCVQARLILSAVANRATTVALSLSADPAQIVTTIESLAPDIIHLGAAAELLSPAEVGSLRQRFAGLRIMRSIPITGEASLRLAHCYADIVDFLLLDSHRPGDNQIGAVGRTHDWSISRRIAAAVRTPVILAGGLGPDNVADAIAAVRPFGVDSKSKTDQRHGSGKDFKRVQAFVAAAKRAAAAVEAPDERRAPR